MSIFEDFFKDGEWDCIGATKNITREEDFNRIIITLYFSQGDSTIQTKVSATYSIGTDGEIAKDEKIGVYAKEIDIFEDEFDAIKYKSDYSRKKENVTGELMYDLLRIIKMFDSSTTVNKKVYL